MRTYYDIGLNLFTRSFPDPERSIADAEAAGWQGWAGEAPNPAEDMRRLKEKVDAGADYIITQMSFDSAKILSFIDDCRAAGIDVPIVPYNVKAIAQPLLLSKVPTIRGMPSPLKNR